MLKAAFYTALDGLLLCMWSGIVSAVVADAYVINVQPLAER